MAKRFNNSKRRLEQEPASLCIRYPVVSLWEGITMRVGIKRATSLLATTVRLWLYIDKDGKAQMIVINKEDQILPAFQIVTKSR